MFKKYNWQQPIFKNDLITVIVFGLTAAILGGALTGLIDALLNSINIGLTFSLLFNALIVGYAVKKGYSTYHILYPTLSLLFLIIALFCSYVSFYVGIVGINYLGAILSLGSTYYRFILDPIFDLRNSFGSNFNFLSFLFAILNIAFTCLAFYGVYRISKGNN